jgi:hypothetical protein
MAISWSKYLALEYNQVVAERDRSKQLHGDKHQARFYHLVPRLHKEKQQYRRLWVAQTLTRCLYSNAGLVGSGYILPNV